MKAGELQRDPYVVLYGIPWANYVGITDALGEYHLRHTYIEGTLEMRGLLHGVTWEDYQAFLKAAGDRSVRHTYHQGTLEIMSPLKNHDWVKRLIGRMIEAMTMDLGIDVQSIGSTTVTGEEIEWGLQPDEAYYIANEPKVRFKKHYDPERDPPPDLVVEVDVTSSSVVRLPGFCAIGVPEVWRHDGKRLHILKRLKSGRYREVVRSLAFPFLSRDDIEKFLAKAGHVRETPLIRSFVVWARKRYKEFYSSN